MYISADKKVWEKIGKDNFIKQPEFWIPLLIGLIVVYATSENIFQKLPSIKAIINLLADFIPSLGEWGKVSEYPSATLILFSYYWALLPYFVIITYRHKIYEKNFVNGWLKKGIKRHFLPILNILFFLVFFSLYYLFALPESDSCQFICIYKSKFIQWVYAFCATLGISGAIASNLWWVKNLKKIHFSVIGEQENQ